MALLICRHQLVLVIVVDLRLGDSNAHTKSLLDESKYFHTQTPVVPHVCYGESVVCGKFCPTGIGLAVVRHALGKVLANDCKLRIYLRIRDGRLGLLLHLLQDKVAIDQAFDQLVAGFRNLGTQRLKRIEAPFRFYVGFKDEIPVHDRDDMVQ